MIHMKLLRTDIEWVRDQLAKRGFTLNVDLFQQLDKRRKTIQMRTQTLQEERNHYSKLIGQKKTAGEAADNLLQQVKKISIEAKEKEKQLNDVQYAINDFLLHLPNIPHTSVPSGEHENDNLEIRRWGKPKQFSFPVKDHTELGEQLGYMDFEAAAKIAGARFVVLYGPLVKLQRALTQFMLDTHANQHGYTEIYVPYMGNRDAFIGTGQLPKFIDDQFKVEGDHEYWLIPTAEVSVTNTIRSEVLMQEQLPLKFVCHTPCFRRESGAYGKDTRGMIRQHQFEKVELVKIVDPALSYDALEILTQDAESILQALELPYRVVSLCTGDLGFSSAKTYDLEVWLPSENQYREISSCSNFEDFQARRLQVRFKNVDGKTALVHTLNGSGLAVGRTLVAVIENYQDEAGNIYVPTVLQSYMNGLEMIKKLS
jgi:seryl-tRNA synthetase